MFSQAPFPAASKTSVLAIRVGKAAKYQANDPHNKPNLLLGEAFEGGTWINADTRGKIPCCMRLEVRVSAELEIDRRVEFVSYESPPRSGSLQVKQRKPAAVCGHRAAGYQAGNICCPKPKARLPGPVLVVELISQAGKKVRMKGEKLFVRDKSATQFNGRLLTPVSLLRPAPEWYTDRGV